MRLSFYPDPSVTPPELHLTPETPEEARRLREALGGRADYCPDGTAVLLRPVEGLPLSILFGQEG